MRKGLTLIELIFSMVIVAIVFTVIPKLIQSMNIANKTTIKENAIFNTITLMGTITKLPWDNNNEENSQILRVTDGSSQFDCNTTTKYRIGGFVGGRTCMEQYEEKNATNIGQEGSYLNDIDDYNGQSIGTLTPCGGNLYDLGVKVSYVDEDDTSKTLPAGKTSNIKHIEITTGYSSDSKYKASDGFCAMFDYFSYNIGYATIQKRHWK